MQYKTLILYLHGIVPTRAYADGEEHQEAATYPVYIQVWLLKTLEHKRRKQEIYIYK